MLQTQNKCIHQLERRDELNEKLFLLRVSPFTALSKRYYCVNVMLKTTFTSPMVLTSLFILSGVIGICIICFRENQISQRKAKLIANLFIPECTLVKKRKLGQFSTLNLGEPRKIYNVVENCSYFSGFYGDYLVKLERLM